MTTPSTARKAGPFLGTGSQTAWPFTFKVFAASDVAVTIANSSGVETALVLDTDYSVSVNANQDSSPGGTVTYPLSGSALPVGSKLSITGDIDYDQAYDIPSGGNFSPVALENQLDRTVMQIQQLKEAVDRAAKLPVTNSEDADALVADLVRLADSADNIDTLVANLADITTVADDLNESVSEINTVAGAIANVNTVGANISNVNTVAGISSNVTSVAGNATNINAVAGNATNINAVAGNATNINAVAGNATNINAVNANKTNIDTVAGNNANVTTVAGISANVTSVAGNATNINTVAANTAAVNTTASNIAAVIAAPSEAAAAAASAAAAAASAAAGMYSAVQDKSADYTVVIGDAGDLIRMTTTGGARVVTLPAISGVPDGFNVTVVKWTGDTNGVTVQRSSTDLINGSTSYVLDAQYKSATFVADAQTSTWFASGSGSTSTNVVVDPFSGTGSQTVFTLSGDPGSENNTQVFVGGVYQEKDTYSVSGTALTFSVAPPAGTSNIEVVWSAPLAIGTPADGTVTTVKLADAAVTAAKMASGAAVANIGFTPADSAVTYTQSQTNALLNAKINTTEIGVSVQAYDADTAKTDVVQSFTAAQRGTVSALGNSSGTITLNMATANNVSMTLTGNSTLANPTNLTAGQSGVITITQDGTGGRTLAYGSQWKFAAGTAPSLTATANAVDVLAYYAESSTRITARLIGDSK